MSCIQLEGQMADDEHDLLVIAEFIVLESYTFGGLAKTSSLLECTDYCSDCIMFTMLV